MEEIVLRIVYVVLVAAVVLAFAMAGGRLARRLHQEPVIGEITAGLLVGPAVVQLAGPHALQLLVPPDVMSALKLVADAGLVLFLVGITHDLRFGRGHSGRSAVGWVSVGSFAPPLCLGALLGGWILLDGPPTIRGTAPGPAVLLFVAVALSITAVPVLARIIADRRMARTATGRLALSAAILQDSAGWLVLSVAVGLNAGTVGGFLRLMLVLLVGVLVAVALRQVLRLPAVGRLGGRHLPSTAVVIAVIALVVGLSVEHLGLTSVFGAALVGVAIPSGEVAPWRPAVAAVSSVGRRLVPLFFAIAGITVFASAPGFSSWLLVVVLIVLGVVGKAGGGYLGARLGGRGSWDALRIGALMNTRGLTELVVLQVGYNAGILTGAFFLAFVIMALATTACTGPALGMIDRKEARRTTKVAGVEPMKYHSA